MAKEKKAAKELTPEEKLTQALVPAEEQPYRVPGNWCWTTVSKVSTVITGGTPSKKFPEYYGNEFPFFKPADLDTGRHVFEASEYLSNRGKESARIIPAHSTAVCCIGSIGKSGYLEIDGATNQQINSAIPHFNPLYQYYFMNTEFFVNQLWAKSSATTISIVNKAKMEACYFPLPPLAEQQRIVDRIESLFVKLDEAKEKAQAVVDGFELRRSAILHKAFTGELTEKWRTEHNIEIEKWKKLSFDECIEKMQNGLAKRTGTDGEKCVVLRLANLLDNGFDTTNLREIMLDEKEIQTYTLHKDDVIMIRVNGSKDNVGKQLLPQYMVYFSQHKNYRLYVKDNMISSAGQNTISRKGMARLKIPIPTLSEQREIIHLLSRLIGKEQQAKEAAESVLIQIDIMKKAILARAFRGELGTNDPDEESAEALLKQIL